MAALIQRFIDIVLLRRGPRDLPDSTFLFALSLLCYLLLGVLGALLFVGSSPGKLIALTLLDVGLLAAWFWIVLWLHARRHRSRQTLTALFGAAALLTGVQILLKLGQSVFLPRQEQALLPAIAVLVVLVWMIVVMAHIMRQALDTTMVVGVIVSLGYALTAITATSTLAGSLG